jgi:hypothetical protein
VPGREVIARDKAHLIRDAQYDRSQRHDLRADRCRGAATIAVTARNTLLVSLTRRDP